MSHEFAKGVLDLRAKQSGAVNNLIEKRRAILLEVIENGMCLTAERGGLSCCGDRGP